MNDEEHDDDERTRRGAVVSPATSDLLRSPPLGDPPAAPVPRDADAQFSACSTAAAFGRDEFGFSSALATAGADMYVVPFGLENCGGVSVGMPGYVPLDPTPSLFQSLPSISAMQSGKFYPPPQLDGKHQSAANVKDELLFQLMTSSSSLPDPPAIGDGYSQHYETQQQQQHDMGGGYGEMTSMMVMERSGQPAAGFLPRCFGTQDMLTGYAPMQPLPVSAYSDGDVGGVLQPYGAVARPSLDQSVNFDVDSEAPAAALPTASFPKPLAATPYSLVATMAGSEPKSSRLYSHHHQHQHLHQLHQLNPHQPPSSFQPHYRLPYQPPPQQHQQLPPSPTHQPPRRDVTSGGAQQPEPETDEINTRAVAARVAAELKRYSVPQAVFAQLVLCRSQGTLSDLLRNPKPWSKLKSGRETFRRMWKWLQEPEYQRMSALRFAGRLSGENETVHV